MVKSENGTVAVDTLTENWTENFTYPELSIGQSASLVRTLTLADIQAFAAVSGDTNPAHLDADYASRTHFHGLIAHGMWGGALISALLGTQFPGAGTIYLRQALDFSKPVRLGDTLTVVATVASKMDEGHRVTLDCIITNQTGERVLGGQALVMAPIEKIRRKRTVAPHLWVFDSAARLQWLLDCVKGIEPIACAVVHPVDAASLTGALDAADHGLIRPVLVGPRSKILAAAVKAGKNVTGLEIRDTDHSHAAAALAAQMALNGDVEIIMKGALHTDELLQAVLAVPGLRTQRRMSHVYRFEVPLYHKPLMVTDAALNIAPTLAEKADIIQNAIDLARLLGVEEPRVAVLAAVETVNLAMQATLDAAALCKMAERRQITGGLLDGPLAFDNAVSLQAANIKDIHSAVAGQADILAVPDLESGNMLAKQLEYLTGASSAGIVLGARVPIALTSRADSVATRVASVVLAVKLAVKARQDPVRQAQLRGALQHSSLADNP
jgi:phosphate acetyltransferase